MIPILDRLIERLHGLSAYYRFVWGRNALIWSISSLTLGSRAIVTIDDATGTVISVERHGLR